MNTLAFGYILPTTGRIPDFHRLETCAAGRTAERQYRTVEIQLPGAAFFVRLFPDLLLRFQFEIHMININGSSFISIPLLSANGCISALLQIG